jgi:hypothetical protein
MQPVYAEHGIATFPVGSDKKPTITDYQRLGLRGSHQLVQMRRHALATSLGFMTNERNRIAALDYDDTDERGFVDALHHYGDTPIKIRTASGKYHAYYRYNGELRLIRPIEGSPIDILGSGGFVVAPPSFISGKGTYQFIEGSLDDLDRLPVMRGLGLNAYPNHQKQQLTNSDQPGVTDGARNDALWEHCMRVATTTRSLSDEEGFNAVLTAAHEFNATFLPPLEEGEVVRVARSAWGYEQRGENRYGRHGVWFDTSEANTLITSDQDSFVLLSYLRAHNGPSSLFMCTNSLSETLGWTEKRLSRARRRLMARGDIILVRPAIQRVPALYKRPRGARPSR